MYFKFNIVLSPFSSTALSGPTPIFFPSSPPCFLHSHYCFSALLGSYFLISFDVLLNASLLINHFNHQYKVMDCSHIHSYYISSLDNEIVKDKVMPYISLHFLLHISLTRSILQKESINRDRISILFKHFSYIMFWDSNWCLQSAVQLRILKSFVPHQGSRSLASSSGFHAHRPLLLHGLINTLCSLGGKKSSQSC